VGAVIFLVVGVALLAFVLLLVRRALPELTHERGDLQGINAFRGLAAMGVLVFHVTFAVPIYGVEMSVVALGSHGVALFFFLSGFLLQRPFAAALKYGRSIEISRYLLHRLMRIVPLYFFVTLVVFAVTRDSLFVLLTSLTFTADYAGVEHVVGVAWTLDDEVAYYLLLPALFLVVSMLVSIRWRLPLAVLAVGGLMVASSQARSGAGPLPQFVPFGVGMLLATATLRSPGGVRLGLLSWAPLVMLGEVSYGVYLWHQPLLHVMFNAGVLSNQFWLATLQLSIWTIAISTATYVAIERPALRLARKRRPKVVLGRRPWQDTGADHGSIAIRDGAYAVEGRSSSGQPAGRDESGLA
jgi:peptidoglycan/LPS O-acetylase OafA/YrhL